MKPVENVSIGGYVFSLETDACETANEYLSKLETFYSKIESGSEVMEGIEERMAELLLEQRG
ncbi:MAG: PspC domain-containing protein, partial [Bacteroidales bacterium]|nr:PspC domain-containing protein [Bacteroidales bacterium]